MLDISPPDPALWDASAARCAEKGVTGYHCLTRNLDDDDDDYGPWWWLFTGDVVPALLRVAGFTVVERGRTWNDHVGLYLARRSAGLGTQETRV